MFHHVVAPYKLLYKVVYNIKEPKSKQTENKSSEKKKHLNRSRKYKKDPELGRKDRKAYKNS